jgi:hypothetical protein
MTALNLILSPQSSTRALLFRGDTFTDCQSSFAPERAEYTHDFAAQTRSGSDRESILS